MAATPTLPPLSATYLSNLIPEEPLLQQSILQISQKFKDHITDQLTNSFKFQSHLLFSYNKLIKNVKIVNYHLSEATFTKNDQSTLREDVLNLREEMDSTLDRLELILDNLKGDFSDYPLLNDIMQHRGSQSDLEESFEHINTMRSIELEGSDRDSTMMSIDGSADTQDDDAVLQGLQTTTATANEHNILADESDHGQLTSEIHSNTIADVAPAEDQDQPKSQDSNTNEDIPFSLDETEQEDGISRRIEEEVTSSPEAMNVDDTRADTPADEDLNNSIAGLGLKADTDHKQLEEENKTVRTGSSSDISSVNIHDLPSKSSIRTVNHMNSNRSSSSLRSSPLKLLPGSLRVSSVAMAVASTCNVTVSGNYSSVPDKPLKFKGISESSDVNK
ncbi:hypothetical protein WICPIJ_001832 [Wickerhamomyces pijperi]|uniref:Uncharacterized protein n=1 Tax=Wickerhamomyces pijperi TaxID=599730 RepID=A0A9P8QA72_WICPI|nr:hypothetical protein WICPIJ_001832 [Wickerhamomyces pijperi]